MQIARTYVHEEMFADDGNDIYVYAQEVIRGAVDGSSYG